MSFSSTSNRTTYRCTFTLPCKLATDISYVARRLGLSQSALLSTLLAEPIADISKLVAVLPIDQTSEPVVSSVVQRLRGASVDILKARIHEALEAARTLDPGLDFGQHPEG